MKISCLPQISYLQYCELKRPVSPLRKLAWHQRKAFFLANYGTKRHEAITLRLVPVQKKFLCVYDGGRIQNSVLQTLLNHALHRAFRTLKRCSSSSPCSFFISIRLATLSSPQILLYYTRPTLGTGDVATHYELHVSEYLIQQTLGVRGKPFLG